MKALGEEVGPARAVWYSMIRTRLTVLIVVLSAFTFVVCGNMYQNWTDQIVRDCRSYVTGSNAEAQSEFTVTLGEAVDEGLTRTGGISDAKLDQLRLYLGDEGYARQAGRAAGEVTNTCTSFFWPWDAPDRYPDFPRSPTHP